MAVEPEKRKRNAAATREAILESGRKAFAKHGYDGAGVREIAAGLDDTCQPRVVQVDGVLNAALPPELEVHVGARDLRMLTSALKIANDLERVGDHAVNIAQSAERLAKSRPITPEPEIIEMARLARGMLSDALEAFIRGDASAGREVCRRDDKVDALHRSVFRILLTHMMEDPHMISAGMDLFLVSRNLERVADLATNIGEDVVFLVEGKSIKHHAEDRGDAPT